MRQHWPAILDAVSSERKVTSILLRNATVHSVEDGVLVLGFPSQGEAKGFAASRHDEVLVQVLTGVLGVKLRVRALAGVPAGSQPASSRPRVADSGPPADPAPAGPRAGNGGPAGGRGGRRQADRPAQPPRPQQRQAPVTDGEWPDEPPDPDDSVDAPETLSGMDLITRQLGGQIIEEIEGD